MQKLYFVFILILVLDVQSLAQRWHYDSLFSEKAFFLADDGVKVFMGCQEKLLEFNYSFDHFDTVLIEPGACFNYGYFKDNKFKGHFVVTNNNRIYWLNAYEKSFIRLINLKNKLIINPSIRDIYATKESKVFISTDMGLFQTALDSFSSKYDTITSYEVMIRRYRIKKDEFIGLNELNDKLIFINDKGIFYLKQKFKKKLVVKKLKPEWETMFYKYKPKRLSKKFRGSITAYVKFVDKERKEYLICAGDSLLKMEKKKWLKVFKSSCLNYPSLGHIWDMKSIDDNLWVVSDSGLTCYNNETKKVFHDSKIKHEKNYGNCPLSIVKKALFLQPDIGGVYKVVENEFQEDAVFNIYLLDRSFNTNYLVEDKENGSVWDSVVNTGIRIWQQTKDTNNVFICYPKGDEYHLPFDKRLLLASVSPYEDQNPIKSRIHGFNDGLNKTIKQIMNLWSYYKGFKLIIITHGTDEIKVPRSTIKELKIWIEKCNCDILLEVLCIEVKNHAELKDCYCNWKFLKKLESIGVRVKFIPESDNNFIKNIGNFPENNKNK